MSALPGVANMTAIMVKMGLLNLVHDIVVRLGKLDRADVTAAVTLGLLELKEVTIVMQINNALIASGERADTLWSQIRRKSACTASAMILGSGSAGCGCMYPPASQASLRSGHVNQHCHCLLPSPLRQRSIHHMRMRNL